MNFFILFLILPYFSFGSELKNDIPKRKESRDFDFLIFTQIWPPTDCFLWEEKSPSHKCNLPLNNEWSIHGIWPTENNKLGPFYCNHSMKFNLDSIEPIEKELEIKWLDVHKGSKPQEFWKHEWEKHGTCAMVIKDVNNEFKYFKKGLDLFKQYDMKFNLNKVKIIPGQKYPLQNYLTGLFNVLQKNVYVECQSNPKTKEQYISEIRICFDKEFKLIDCNNVVHFPSNCDKTKDVIYLTDIQAKVHNEPRVIQI